MTKTKKLKRARGAKWRAMAAGLVPVPAGYVDPRLGTKGWQSKFFEQKGGPSRKEVRMGARVLAKRRIVVERTIGEAVRAAVDAGAAEFDIVRFLDAIADGCVRAAGWRLDLIDGGPARANRKRRPQDHRRR